jgi:hypothetical protein
MPLRTNRLITLAIIAILVLVLACGTEEDQTTNGDGVASAPTATPTPADVIDDAPVSFPFPVVELVVDGVRYPSAQGGYCWPDAVDGDSIISICADMALDWELDERIAVPHGTSPVIEIDYPETATALYANFYRDPQIRSEAVQIDILAEGDRTLDLSAYVMDDVYLRVSGNWPTGQADFLFRMQPVPSGEDLAAVCFATEAEPLPLTYKVLNDPTPTGFDGRNNGACTFNKPISSIIVMLNNGPGGSFHGETFHLKKPLYEIDFPLKAWGESVKTLELLAPGPYERAMVAESTDGEQWTITEHVSAALDEVTVIPSDEPTPMPVREWDIEDVSVDGSTVTVIVRLYVSIVPTVVIDGIQPDQVIDEIPLKHYVFENVTSGMHELTVSDVVGHTDGRVVQVP